MVSFISADRELECDVVIESRFRRCNGDRRAHISPDDVRTDSTRSRSVAPPCELALDVFVKFPID